jgi:hypothetical protein
MNTEAEILSPKALALLQEIEHTPRSIGYTLEIAELQDAGFIEWESGWGYIASEKGHQHLSAVRAA